MNSILIFLETSDIGARYSAEAAKRLGFEPLFLLNPSAYQADTRDQLADYRILPCDTGHVQSMFEVIKQAGIENIAGVTTLLDSRLVPALELASLLNVPGLDPAVAKLKDKGRVADLVGEFGPPTIRFHRSQIPFEKIRSLAKAHGRVVLKPTQTAGGIGNFTLDPDQIDSISGLIESSSLPAALDEGFWVAQAHCSGPLVSLEGYVEDGKVKVLGYSGRRKVGLTESQVNFPADQSIPPEQRQRCLSAIEHLVSRSGFKHGYLHVEFILLEHGVAMIDANVGRLGGGSVGEQIADSFGIDPVDVYVHVIRNSIFPRQPNPSPYGNHRVPTLGILYGVHTPGQFEELSISAAADVRHTQILDSGQTIPQMGINNWSWIGILSGPTENVQATLSKIRIRNSGEWQSPCY